MITTPGRMLLESALPEGVPLPAVLDKKSVGQLFGVLADKYPDRYVDILQRFNDVARRAATEYGGEASFGMDDLMPPKSVRRARDAMREKVRAIAQSDIDPKEKNRRIISLMNDHLDKIRGSVEEEALKENNFFAKSIRHGFRGSPAQLTQLLYGDLLVADQKGRPVPTPGMHGYGEGVTPMEYWAAVYGARKGMADVQFATAKTGYFGKQLALMAQRQRVTGSDCGAWNRGVPYHGNSEALLGKVLAQPTGGVSAGKVIDRKDLARLQDEDEVIVRSPLTCKQGDGVCQKCLGKDFDNRFPAIGDWVGITRARTTAEPLTQTLGLANKHVGGMVGENEATAEGFDEINQFFQIPESFLGKAVLAPRDGIIGGVVPAPQGGSYVKVDGETVYVPQARALSVKPGTRVEAGDMLTDGTPNPAEIVRHKGLGEGRRYFADMLEQILERNGVGTDRRNIETVTAPFLGRVKITDPSGVGGYDVGEVVSYAKMQEKYAARKGAEQRAPRQALNTYLEEPVLHYTIGTRVTPSITERLKRYGVEKVTVHRDPPGFEPDVTRLAAFLEKDPDWKTRMSGFNLSRTFIDAATHGSVSPHKGTSYVPGLMNPTEL